MKKNQKKKSVNDFKTDGHCPICLQPVNKCTCNRNYADYFNAYYDSIKKKNVDKRLEIE